MIKEDISSASHGNVPYAWLDRKPHILSKEGHLDYCQIRRFPMMSWRKLCCALKRNSLPLQHDIFQKLIRQTLYQIGDLHFISNHECPKLLMEWRDYDTVEFFNAIVPILLKMCNNQKQQPQLYKASAMIGEISNYILCLQQLNGECIDAQALDDVTIELARVAMGWAKDYDDEMMKL